MDLAVLSVAPAPRPDTRRFPLMPAAGKIAFVAQSAAVASTVLEWAKAKGIGFSCAVHLGDSPDIDSQVE